MRRSGALGGFSGPRPLGRGPACNKLYLWKGWWVVSGRWGWAAGGLVPHVKSASHFDKNTRRPSPSCCCCVLPTPLSSTSTQAHQPHHLHNQPTPPHSPANSIKGRVRDSPALRIQLSSRQQPQTASIIQGPFLDSTTHQVKHRSTMATTRRRTPHTHMMTILLLASLLLVQTALAFLLPSAIPSSSTALARRRSGASVQPLAVKRAGRRGGGNSGGGGFGSSRGPGGRRGKDDGAEASKDPEKRLANLNRKLSSILEVCMYVLASSLDPPFA